MLNLNLGKVEKKQAPNNERQPMPEGRYQVMITHAEVKPTKAGTGKYIKVEFTVQEGEYKRWKLWQMFNIENPNPQAVEIGLQQLKDMLLAANSNLADETLASVSQLNGLRMTANVVIEISEQYGEQNRINYFDVSESTEGGPDVANIYEEEIPF